MQTSSKMNDTIKLLINVLQEHSNEIRKVQVLNIALTSFVHKQLHARFGVPLILLQQEFLQHLSDVEKVGPPHDWAKGIQLQIDKALEWAGEMERQSKEGTN
jgi:hypothetical protein